MKKVKPTQAPKLPEPWELASAPPAFVERFKTFHQVQFEAEQAQIDASGPNAELLARHVTPTCIEGYETFPELQAAVLDLREQVAEFEPFKDALENHDIETADDLEEIITKATTLDGLSDKLDELETEFLEMVDELLAGQFAETMKTKLIDRLNKFEEDMKS